jgi:hypothetical protein
MYGCDDVCHPDFKEAAEMINGPRSLDFITQTMDLEHTQEGLDVLAKKRKTSSK